VGWVKPAGLAFGKPRCRETHRQCVILARGAPIAPGCTQCQSDHVLVGFAALNPPYETKIAGGTHMLIRSLGPAVAALLALAEPASAQQWPTQPIHIVIPFGPGGGSDIVGRILGQSLQEKLGQPVVIENRPGAGGTIGNDAIARSSKD